MPLPNKKGWLAILFIFFCLAIPFGMTYYSSTQQFKDRYSHWQTQFRSVGVPEKSRVTAGQVVLIKNEKLKIANTCIVFKGLDQGQVVLDLYLLDLDQTYPYPQRFSKENKTEVIRLGDMAYSVSEADKNSLTLKIQQTFEAQ